MRKIFAFIAFIAAFTIFGLAPKTALASGQNHPCNPDDYNDPDFLLTYDPTPGPSRWDGVPGADVQAGETNTQTPEKRRDAFKLVKHYHEYELYHELTEDMPVNPQAGYDIQSFPTFIFDTHQAFNGDTFNATAFAQIATQLDAFVHFGYYPPDGLSSDDIVYYGGFTGDEVHGPNGFHFLGVEHLKPITTRAILVDVKRFMNDNEMLPPGFEITKGHLICTLKAQKMDPWRVIEEGDAVLINTGWEEMWTQPSHIYYQGGPGLLGGTPGISLEAAFWLSEFFPVAVGSDAWAVEVATDPWFDPQPSPKPAGVSFPGHHQLIVKSGIVMIETMHLGELAEDIAAEHPRKKDTYLSYLHVPRVPMVGATGSVTMPIAMR